MGVHGLVKLLKEEGLLPPEKGCSKALWRSQMSGDVFDGIARLEPHSTLALDGNGLAHYLHDVAYSRHFDKVTSSGTAGSKTMCSCRTKHLSKAQVTCLLPQFMPLALLDQVTKEFVESLQKNQMKLVVYWDGPDRRMKAATTGKRKQQHDSQWSLLRQYCAYGVVPRASSSLCRQDWLQNFPITRLLMQQVRFTLGLYQNINMIDCKEEADRQVAQASADSPNCYCVGMDSDFLLFPGTRYVPLNTLDASGNVVTACVLTRAQVAKQLDLPCEASVVEMGILLGNDYVDGSSKDLDFVGSKKELILDHLREQGADYRVTSKVPQVHLALAFTRALFEFEDLSEFPTDESDDEEDEDSERQESPEELERPVLPVELDLELAVPKPMDFSVFSVVSRPLQACIDQGEEEGQSLIGQKHLDAYRQVTESLEKQKHQLSDIEVERPSWKNVLAAYVIERTIAFLLRSGPSSRLVRLSDPASLFDHQLFHSFLKEDSTNGVSPVVASALEDEPEEVEQTILPIDEHEERILDAVKDQRVTIIHGETGCGKSSRVPVMLLRTPPPDPSMRKVKMFISQPRRIAAKSLVERVRSCEPDLRDSIALRMGHGVREYESSKTRAWFVTTGYLVRLLANNPERFNDCSHLIIDEVHERSVDTDILCLLCRRLLKTNSRIRLILMSATMAATLYQEYFGVPEPPIHVGARRFPIKEYFVEDIIKTFSLTANNLKAANKIVEDCNKTRLKSPPNNSYMDNLFRLSAHLVLCVGRPGASILIFVPGMNEIISVTDQVESLYVPGVRFTCVPIHSDVPFEEQMTAFDSPSNDEVKIVIATNAAESSITLPNVDHVICLGLQKQIEYNPNSHRQILMPAWISRASAIQRAGRTGRVRNGNVYRLYTKTAFHDCMDMFETGEMLRMPLDSVILDLKEMLQEEATPVLLESLEPPNLSTIERSFESLCKARFITSPDDSGTITTLGKFVTSLGIDLLLGSLVGLGIQFGVGAEAVEMAAVLSFPKSPWAMTNPLWHEPAEFNDITAKTFISKCHFDANLYSEPLAIMNLMWEYEAASSKHGWARHYAISVQRLRRLITTKNSLRNRVAEFCGIDSDSLCMEKPPVLMEHAKVNLLRVLQVWVFSDTMIESIQACNAVDGAVTLKFTGDDITDSHLEQVLDRERHPFVLARGRQITQSGKFTPVCREGEEFSFDAFHREFEIRFVSFGVERGLKLFWYNVNDSLYIFVNKQIEESEKFVGFCRSRLAQFKRISIAAEKAIGGSRRGRKERACGLWDVRYIDNSDAADLDDKHGAVRLAKLGVTSNKTSKNILRYLNKSGLDFPGVTASVACSFSGGKKPSLNFSLLSRGNCSEVSKEDLKDLFATPNVSSKTGKVQSLQRTITFNQVTNTPMTPYAAKQEGEPTSSDSSWCRPLLHDMPEGARLLSILASGRRKEHCIFLSPLETEGPENGTASDDDGNESLLKVKLDQNETKISQRWRQYMSKSFVYVDENCPPAAGMSMSGPIEVFGCCANTLEVRGGGLRVEGLTLLPPGRLFLLLSLLSFGLFPDLPGNIENEENDHKVLSRLLKYLDEWDQIVASAGDTPSQLSPEINEVEKIQGARAFHESCIDLGETLVCHPDKVRSLCKIFDLVDGYTAQPWENLDDNPFTLENLAKKKTAVRQRASTKDTAVNAHPATTSPLDLRPSTLIGDEAMTAASATVAEVAETPVRKKKSGRARKKKNGRSGTPTSDTAANGHPATSAENLLASPVAGGENVEAIVAETPAVRGRSSFPKMTLVVDFPDHVVSAALSLFSTDLEPGASIAEVDLPSTNILSILMKHFCDFILEKNIMPEDKDEIMLEGNVSLTDRHWQVHTLLDQNGKTWYFAEFVGTAMPFLSVKKRGKLPRWIYKGRPRPCTIETVLKCLPPHMSSIPHMKARVELSECETGEAIFFESVEMALRMEAAFWLERQFGNSTRHWYQLPLSKMMQKVTTLEHVVLQGECRRF